MKMSGCYYVVVVEDLRKKKIIGSATLVVEMKFIHNCCLVIIRFVEFNFFVSLVYDNVTDAYAYREDTWRMSLSMVNIVANSWANWW